MHTDWSLFCRVVDALGTHDVKRGIANRSPRDKVAQAHYMLALIRFERALNRYDALRSPTGPAIELRA